MSQILLANKMFSSFREEILLSSFSTWNIFRITSNNKYVYQIEFMYASKQIEKSNIWYGMHVVLLSFLSILSYRREPRRAAPDVRVRQVPLLQGIGACVRRCKQHARRCRHAADTGHVLQVSFAVAANVQGTGEGRLGDEHELLRVSCWLGPVCTHNISDSNSSSFSTTVQHPEGENRPAAAAWPDRCGHFRFYHPERRSAPLRDAQRSRGARRQRQRFRPSAYRSFGHTGAAVSVLHVSVVHLLGQTPITHSNTVFNLSVPTSAQNAEIDVGAVADLLRRHNHRVPEFAVERRRTVSVAERFAFARHRTSAVARLRCGRILYGSVWRGYFRCLMAGPKSANRRPDR